MDTGGLCMSGNSETVVLAMGPRTAIEWTCCSDPVDRGCCEVEERFAGLDHMISEMPSACTR